MSPRTPQTTQCPAPSAGYVDIHSDIVEVLMLLAMRRHAMSML